MSTKTIKDMVDQVPDLVICGRSLADFLADIEAFHGFLAPGVVLGGLMVDQAQEKVGPGVEADAVVETCRCLPDAVQIFTPCTAGNGWLKILDWQKFALTLYDKGTLLGYRVWLDLEKARRAPHIYNWYMGLVPKKDLPLEVLLDTIIKARRSVFSCVPVRVTRLYGKREKGEIKVCPSCGEAYPALQGDQCAACQGQGYYEPRE